MAQPTMGWHLMHQLIIKTIFTDMQKGQSDPQLMFSSQNTLGCIILTIKGN